jgi:hypothetical protein
MRLLRIALLLTFLAGGCAGNDTTTEEPMNPPTMSPRSHIPRSDLEQMFDGIRRQTDWNMDEDMLWGYFFTDTRPDRLKAAGTVQFFL